jgi:predicted cupin superfamily sugar epimerase
MLTAERLMALLNLEPLAGEGGFFRRTYTGPEMPATAAATPPSGRAISSAIYYLLFDEHFSAMHCLRTDEVYHFYLGDPVELLLLYPDGGSQVVVLGSDLEAGQQTQFVAPAGVWQGSRVRRGGRLALMGTTMAPAFTPEDFELGERARLLASYPEQAELIMALTHA